MTRTIRILSYVFINVHHSSILQFGKTRAIRALMGSHANRAVSPVTPKRNHDRGKGEIFFLSVTARLIVRRLRSLRSSSAPSPLLLSISLLRITDTPASLGLDQSISFMKKRAPRCRREYLSGVSQPKDENKFLSNRDLSSPRLESRS